MLTTMTVGPVLASAGEAVTPFGGLIVFVVAMSVGFGVVQYIISKAKAARRG